MLGLCLSFIFIYLKQKLWPWHWRCLLTIYMFKLVSFVLLIIRNNQSHVEMLVIYYLFDYFYMLSHYNDIQINTKCPTPLNCWVLLLFFFLFIYCFVLCFCSFYDWIYLRTTSVQCCRSQAVAPDDCKLNYCRETHRMLWIASAFARLANMDRVLLIKGC